ncbi:MAG: hypothetical protein JNM70_01870 [Anaerolineae bacterium]|nr:hypothetical protein [Anaerolineae bacterium]
MTISQNPRLPYNLWRICLVAMTAAGFSLALTGYNHGLPFIDYSDEMTMWTRGRATIDPTWDMFQPEYPPGMVWLSALVQSIQIARGDPYIDPAGATAVGRLSSVAAYCAALAVIMLVTWRLVEAAWGGWQALLAGVSAGLFWMLLPLAVLHARYAMPDAWVSLGFMAAIDAGLEGWRRSSERWLWLSLLLAILATLFKWQAAVTLLVPGLMFLRFWPDRRRLLRIGVIYAVIVGGFSIWVVFVRRALEGGLYMPGTEVSAPTPFTVLDNLLFQVLNIGPGWIFGLLALAGLLLPASRRLIRDRALWTLPLMVILLNGVISINGSRLFERHYLPGAAALAVLAGIGLSGLTALLWRWGWIGRTAGLGAVVITLATLWGMAGQVYAMTAEYVRPDRRVLFAEWAGQNALDGVMMVTDRNLAAAIDPLYGYRGQKIATPEWGAFIAVEDVTDEKLAATQTRYLVKMPFITLDHLTTPLTPLITSGDDARLRGETWTVLYAGDLPPLLTPPYPTFGSSIELRGAWIRPEAVCPGEAVESQFLWGAGRPPEQYYSYFLHFWSEATGEISAPINGLALAGEDRPTLSWTVRDELLVGPPKVWTVPDDLPPGDYDLWLGVFEPVSGVRLALDDGRDVQVAGRLTVKSCPV